MSISQDAKHGQGDGTDVCSQVKKGKPTAHEGVKIGPGLTCLSLASARSRQVPLSDDWNGQINSADHPFLPPPSLPMFRLTLGSLGVAGWLPCWGYTVLSRKRGTWIWVGSDIASGRTLRLLLASGCCFLEPFPNTKACQGAPQTQSVSGPLPLPAWTCLNLSAVLSAQCAAATGRPHVIEGAAERQNRGQSQCPSPLSTAPLGPNPPGPLVPLVEGRSVQGRWHVRCRRE